LPLFRDDWPDDADDAEAIHPEFIAPDVLEAVEQSERAALVREAVRQLPPQQRLVIYCLHWLDMPQREIALITGVTEGRVSQIVKAAHAALRPELAYLYN
jgi:RNA polymerase sigma factor (sigma-70 family)